MTLLHRSVVALALLTCALASEARAEDLTSAQVLEKASQAYKALSSYRDREVVRMQVSVKGDDGKTERNSQEIRVSTTFQRPNRLRLEVDSQEWPCSLVMDGQKRTFFLGTLKEYSGGPMSNLKWVLREALSQIILGPVLMTGLLDELAGINGPQAFAIGAASSKLLKSDKVDGSDCYVVEVLREVPAVPLAAEVRNTRVPYEIAFDKQSFLARRVTVDFAPMLKEMAKKGPGQVPQSMVVTASLGNLEPNAAVKAEDFAFAPPSDAKEVTVFSDRRLDVVVLPQDMTGQPAPEFSLDSIAGKQVKMADLKGQVVILHFFTMACQPCLDEIPALDAVYQKYKSQGLQVFGVSMDQAGTEQLGPWTIRTKIHYPVLLGDRPTRDMFGRFNGLPATFIMDRQGVCRFEFSGRPSNLTIYEEKVKTLLAEKPAADAPAASPAAPPAPATPPAVTPPAGGTGGE
jgi:peroxiredoxin/outer membrane lipoprotein-sorting protein